MPRHRPRRRSRPARYAHSRTRARASCKAARPCSSLARCPGSRSASDAGAGIASTMKVNCSSSLSARPSVSRLAVRTSESAAAVPCSISPHRRRLRRRSASSGKRSRAWRGLHRTDGLHHSPGQSGTTVGARFVRKKGRVLVGFRERAAPYVAELAACEVLSAPAGALITPLAEMLNELSIREQLPQIEVAIGENATALVLRVLKPPSGEDRARLAAFAAAQGVRFYLQSGAPDALEPLGEASEALAYSLPQFGLEMQFAPTDFIQVNAAVNQALVGRAVSLLGLTADAAVLDLFCGLGNFTLAVARHAGSVVGIEGEETLVGRARANAARNNIGNAAFHRVNLGVAPDATAPWCTARYTHVLLDPPRSGAREVLEAVARFAPRRLLYISCHPGSLARDLEVLVHGHGFKLAAAGVVDMFPHTAHVESLALLTDGSDFVTAPTSPA